MIETFSILSLLFLIIILVFFIRKPFFNFPMDEDAGFYTYIPYFQNRGLRFVEDCWGIFPPTLIFVIKWLYEHFEKDIRTVRIFSTIYHLLTVLSLFFLGQQLFGSQAALLSAFFYAVYASAPFLSWFSIHTENYYLLPVTWGLYFYLLAVNGGEEYFLLLSGICFSTAFWIKIVVAGYVFFFDIYLLSLNEMSGACYFLLGFSGPALAYLGIQTYIFRGRNKLFWFQFYLRLKGFSNISKLKWKYGNPLKDFFILFSQTVPVWTGVMFFFIEPINPPLIIYGAATLFIFLLQKAYSSYHYLPVIHLLSLVSGGMMVRAITDSGESPLFYIPVILVFSGSIVFSLWNFRKFISPEKASLEFEKFDQYAYVPLLVRELKRDLSSSDRIYVWGPYTQIYQMSGVPAVDKYLHYFRMPYSKVYTCFFDTIIDGIRKHRPKYIILVFPNFNINVLKQLTGLTYSVEKIFFNRFKIVRLTGVEENYNSNVSEGEKLLWLERLTHGNDSPDIDPYYHLNNNYDLAIQEAERALLVNPGDWRNSLYLGIIFLKQKKYDKAEQLFCTVLKKAPRRTGEEAKMNMGILFRQRGKHREALGYFEDLYKTSSYPSLKGEALVEEGITFRELNECEEALKKFKEVELFSGKDCALIVDRARLEAGITHRDMGDFEGAIHEFEKIHEESAILYHARIETGIAYRKTGKYDKAFLEFEKMKEIPSVADRICMETGITRRKTGEIEKAIKLFDFGRTNFLFESDYFTYLLASTLEEANREQEALKYFESVLESTTLKKNMKGGCYFHMGKIYMLLGDKKKAEENLAKCLELIPEHREARLLSVGGPTRVCL